MSSVSKLLHTRPAWLKLVPYAAVIYLSSIRVLRLQAWDELLACCILAW